MITITNKVKEILHEIIPNDFQGALHTTYKLHDLDMHDTDKITLAVELEQAFKISIPDEDAKKWKTIQHVISYVRRAKLNQGSSKCKGSRPQNTRSNTNRFIQTLQSLFKATFSK